jgi:hypothetical protein
LEEQRSNPRKIVSAIGKAPSGEAVLLAQIRNSSAFDQMLAKNRYLLVPAKKTSVNLVHRGLFFQASGSLVSAHDFPIPGAIA